MFRFILIAVNVGQATGFWTGIVLLLFLADLAIAAEKADKLESKLKYLESKIH